MSEILLPKIVDDEYTFKSLRYASYSSDIVYDDVKISKELGEYDVLIKNEVFTIHQLDIILNKFSYSLIGPKRKGMGCDFAGSVVKAGSKSKFVQGDMVYGFIFNFFLPIGTAGEYCVINEKTAPEINKIPRGMSFAEAAAMVVTSCTAYQTLREHKDLKGKNVLVLGAGTCVGTYSVQLAKHFYGANKVVATCSPRSFERINSYGADVIVDYTKGDEFKSNSLLEFVKENGKFDLVIDTVRDISIGNRSIEFIKGNDENGVLAVINGSSSNDYENIHFIDVLPTWDSTKSWLKSMWSNSNPKVKIITFRGNEGFGETMEKLWNEKKLMIPIDSEFNAMTQYKEAIKRVASFKAKGKVVCNF